MTSPRSIAALLLAASLPFLPPLPAARGEPARETPGTCRSLLQGSRAYREDLTYAIKWGVITAGSATVRMTPVPSPGGLTYRIDTEARSTSFIDVFYPVRDKASSVAGGDFGRSLFFSKSQREGRFSRDEVIEFDTVEGTSLLFRDGKLRKALRMPASYQDPLSGLYSFRRMSVSPGETVGMYATDGQRLMLVKGIIMGREEVSVPAGRFQCLKVELFPETLEGPFMRKKHGRLFLWFTDDDCRLMVKFSTEVIIGSVELVLEKMSYNPL